MRRSFHFPAFNASFRRIAITRTSSSGCFKTPETLYSEALIPTSATMSIPSSQQKEFHLLTMNTPNGKKVQIALEELKLKYPGFDFSYELVNIMTNRQKEDWFLKLNPNGRIPVLLDNKVGAGKEPFSVMESAACCLYLAKRVDKNHEFGFSDDLERSECLQWMFFTHGGIGPMQGQLGWFNRNSEQIETAIKRYHDETLRLYGVLELQLSGKYTNQKKDYLVGAGAGVAIWKMVKINEEEMAQFPGVLAWMERIEARPAVKSGAGEAYK